MSTTQSKSNPTWKRVLVTFVSLLLVATFVLGATIAISGEPPKWLAGTPPTNIGIHSGQLAPCPSTANCVNSRSSDTTHKIEPLIYESSPQEAMAKLKTAVQSFKQAKIIEETKDYLYAEFTIPIVGFVDDVEFLLDENTKSIQVRSASRLGESDLGVNRKRIETLRAKLS